MPLPPPPGVEASFDLDGLTATLPGVRLSRRDVLTIAALLIGGTELFLLLFSVVDALINGATGPDERLTVVIASALALPVLLSGFIAMMWVRGASSPITITLRHTHGATYRWVDNNFDQHCDIYDIAEATVPEGGDPRVLLRLRDGSGQEWRVRRWVDARWLSAQLNEAVALAAARQGRAVVPEAIRRLRTELPKQST